MTKYTRDQLEQMGTEKLAKTALVEVCGYRWEYFGGMHQLRPSDGGLPFEGGPWQAMGEVVEAMHSGERSRDWRLQITTTGMAGVAEASYMDRDGFVRGYADDINGNVPRALMTAAILAVQSEGEPAPDPEPATCLLCGHEIVAGQEMYVDIDRQTYHADCRYPGRVRR